MAVKVNSCCCCIELKTGCLILGYIGLIESILMGILIIFSFDKVCQMVGTELPDDPSTIKAIVIAALAATFIFMVINIVFLVGVHQNKRGHVKCYLVYGLIVAVVSTIAYVMKIVTGTDMHSTVSMLMNIVIQIYYLIVVRSYYFKMKEREPRQEPLNELTKA